MTPPLCPFYLVRLGSFSFPAAFQGCCRCMLDQILPRTFFLPPPARGPPPNPPKHHPPANPCCYTFLTHILANTYLFLASPPVIALLSIISVTQNFLPSHFHHSLTPIQDLHHAQRSSRCPTCVRQQTRSRPTVSTAPPMVPMVIATASTATDVCQSSGSSLFLN